MALSAAVKKLLNNMTPGAKTAKLGDLMEKATAQGVAVADAAGAAPTAAEYKALLDSLRNAGIIAKS